MVKGAKRNMIVLRDTDSALYEEAYFLLREDLDEPIPAQTALIEEANRIVCDNLITASLARSPRKARKTDGLIWYLTGLLSGLGFAFLLMLF